MFYIFESVMSEFDQFIVNYLFQLCKQQFEHQQNLDPCINGSQVCISLCPLSLNICTFNGWLKSFFHWFVIFWASTVLFCRVLVMVYDIWTHDFLDFFNCMYWNTICCVSGTGSVPIFKLVSSKTTVTHCMMIIYTVIKPGLTSD